MAKQQWTPATPRHPNLPATAVPLPGLARSNVSLGQHRAEQDALELIRLTREKNLKFMFGGAKVTFKVASAASAAKTVALRGKAIAKGASTLASGTGQASAHVGAQFTSAAGAVGAGPPVIKDFLKDVLNVQSLSEVRDIIPANEMSNLVADFTPFLGTVTSGAKMLTSWGKTAQMAYKQYQTKKRVHDLLVGDPRAAGEALRRMLQEEMAKYAADGAIHTTKFAVSAASMPADGGTTANLVLAAVSLVKTLFEIGWDVHVMRLGNEHLSKPNALSLDVFDDCPLLGCYLLVNSNTSDIVNLILEEMGQPGWMDDVEQMVKGSIAPMVGDANSMIAKSRLEVVGVRGNNFIDGRSGAQKIAHRLHPVSYNKRKQAWSKFKSQFKRG